MAPQHGLPSAPLRASSLWTLLLMPTSFLCASLWFDVLALQRNVFQNIFLSTARWLYAAWFDDLNRWLSLYKAGRYDHRCTHTTQFTSKNEKARSFDRAFKKWLPSPPEAETADPVVNPPQADSANWSIYRWCFRVPIHNPVRFLGTFPFSWLHCKNLEFLYISGFRKIPQLDHVTRHERFLFSAGPAFDLRFSFSGLRKGW